MRRYCRSPHNRRAAVCFKCVVSRSDDSSREIVNYDARYLPAAAVSAYDGVMEALFGNHEGNVMRKIVIALVAATTLAATALATSAPANARWGYGWGGG